jgi:hypothetical protein
VRPDGFNINFNSYNDSIFINTAAALNQTWVIYTFPNGDLVKGTVSSIMTETVNTFSDSVKTITLSVTNSGGTGIIHSMNGKQLKISRDQGWFQSLNWRDFPNDTARYIIEPAKRLTFYDVYNFNIGDKIDRGVTTGNCGFPSVHHYTIMSKSVSGTNASYNVADTSYYIVATGGNPPYQWQSSVSSTTWNHSIANTYIFGSQMPDQVGPTSVLPQNIPYPYQMWASGGAGTCSRTYRAEINNPVICYWDTAQLCYKGAFEPIWSNPIYVSGQGEELYYNFSALNGGCYYTVQTYYYYNGLTGSTCGSHVALNIREEKRNQLKVYPNPASDLLVAESQRDWNDPSIRVVDILGKGNEVGSVIEGKQVRLDISTLAPGMYILMIGTEGENYSIKFVK